MPREIISGDFYWAAKTDDGIIAVVGDCTGHGIPGAFMSILGISLLNKVVKEQKITSPAKILNRLREELLKALIHDEEEDKPYDGIDLSLVKINYAEHKLIMAAANHLIYIVNPEEGELKEYKGDRMPIGLYEVMKEFNEFEVRFHEGQIIYLFTDGYPDQFGGPYSKKFKYSRFKETLLEICTLPMEQQKIILKQRIEEWMSYPDRKHKEPRHEQIDDILIFGIKL
jgi:serine phosphatase RsbU (regulator of sigma subunit)